MVGWDALQMYCVAERAFQLVYGLLSDYFAEMFRARALSPSPAAFIEPYDTGALLSSGPLPLQSGVKTPTIRSGLNTIMYYMGGSPRDQVFDRRNNSVSKEYDEVHCDSVAITRATKLHGRVAAGSSLKAAQPLPSTLPN